MFLLQTVLYFHQVTFKDLSQRPVAKALVLHRNTSGRKGGRAVAHLRAAVTWYVSMGVKVNRVMTNNGSCYKSRAFKAACAELGIRHIRTKPYTPQTNGKAERFIQTALREWAYARAYQASDDRAADLPVWTHLPIGIDRIRR